MYSFDEHGNAVVDEGLRQAVEDKLYRGRSQDLSPRFNQLYRHGFGYAANEIVTGVRSLVLRPIVTRVDSVMREHKILTGRNSSLLTALERGQDYGRTTERVRADVYNAYSASLTRFINQALKGFEGPLPLKVDNGLVVMFMSPDISFLRYLRMLSHRLSSLGITLNCEFHSTEDVSSQQFNSTRIRARDGGMYITVGIIFNNGVASLLGFCQVASSLMKVLRTLSRRMVSVDGRFGEYSQWQMPMFRNRMCRHFQRLEQVDPMAISGRSSNLRDRGALNHAELRHRHIVQHASGEELSGGSFQWR